MDFDDFELDEGETELQSLTGSAGFDDGERISGAAPEPSRRLHLDLDDSDEELDASGLGAMLTQQDDTQVNRGDIVEGNTSVQQPTKSRHSAQRRIYNCCSCLSGLIVLLLLMSMTLAMVMPWYMTQVEVVTAGSKLVYERESQAFFVYERCKGEFLCDSVGLSSGMTSWSKGCGDCSHQRALFGSMWGLTALTMLTVLFIVFLSLALIVYIKAKKRYSRKIAAAVVVIIVAALLCSLLSILTVVLFVTLIPTSTSNDFSTEECENLLGLKSWLPVLQPTHYNPCESAFGRVKEKFSTDTIEFRWGATWGWYWTLVIASLCFLLMVCLTASSCVLMNIYRVGALQTYQPLSSEDATEGLVPMAYIIDFPLPAFEHTFDGAVEASDQLTVPGMELIQVSAQQTRVPEKLPC